MKAVLTSEAKLEFNERKKAYQLAFNSPMGRAVIEHLAPFCRAKATCVVIGDRDMSYVFEGRRQVYLMIQDYLDLTAEELIEKYTLRPAEGATSHD